MWLSSALLPDAVWLARTDRPPSQQAARLSPRAVWVRKHGSGWACCPQRRVSIDCTIQGPIWQMIQTGTCAAKVLFQKNFELLNTMFGRLDFERMWFHPQHCFTVHYFKRTSVYQQHVAFLFQRHEESSELWLSKQVDMCGWMCSSASSWCPLDLSIVQMNNFTNFQPFPTCCYDILAH